VREWQTEERVGAPPIGAGSSFDAAAHPIGDHLRTLGALRAAHPTLATGSSVVRRAQGNVLVVSRLGTSEYVTAFNNGTAAARVTVTTSTPSSSWTPLLGIAARGSSGAGGALSFEIPALTAVVLRADAPLPVRAPVAPRVAVGLDDLSGLWRVSATGGTPASVTFAVKRAKGKRWARLATDDSPPFRAFLDPGRYGRDERVELVAISRAVDGRTAVSRVVPFRVRRP
jgi:hypothetical protein